MSDYDEFVKRMGSFDMELSLDDIGEGNTEDDTLKHYGVKGMKWGVRKSVSGYKRAGMVTKKRQLAKDKKDLAKVQSGKGRSVGFTKSVQKKRKPKEKERDRVKKMTNEELQAVNKRMQLEQQYSQLKKQTQVVSTGRRVVTDFANGTGTATRGAVQGAIAATIVKVGKDAIVKGLKAARK